MPRASGALAGLALALSCGYPNPAGSHADAGTDSGPVGPLRGFRFRKTDNPSLPHDLEGTISGAKVTVVGFEIDPSQLVPTVDISAGATVTCNREVLAGQVHLDFRHPVTCTLDAPSTTPETYTVTVEDRELELGSAVDCAGNPLAIAIGDLDGDGVPDVIEADGTSLYLARGLGGAMFDACQPSTLALTAVAIADLDGDRRPDLVVGTTNADQRPVVRAMTNRSAGSDLAFDNSDVVLIGAPTSVAVGQIDGDGRPDVALAAANFAAVVFNRGAAGSDASLTSDSAADSSSDGIVTIADMTADGIPDLVIAGSAGLAVCPGQGSGAAYALGSEQLPSARPLTNPALAVATADFAHVGSAGVAVLTAAGIQTFGWAGDATLDLQGNGTMTAADLDADGVPDLVVLGASTTSNMVALIATPGEGFVVLPNALAAVGEADLVGTGDLDEDGRPDFVFDGGSGVFVVVRTVVKSFP